MSLCTKGKELIVELKRSEWLPPYNENGVRQVIGEVNALHEQILEKFSVYGDELDEHKSVHTGIVVNHQCLIRNKRCLLAYLNHRLEKVKDLRWQTGSVIPDKLSKNLCRTEKEFFKDYDQLLTKYMGSFDLDLTADMSPPKELFIEVRVLEDCGEIYTENGTINLTVNTCHFLRRSDAEHLIRQGMLEHVKY